MAKRKKEKKERKLENNEYKLLYNKTKGMIVRWGIIDKRGADSVAFILCLLISNSKKEGRKPMSITSSPS
jgi:hypothetical protein